MLALVGFVGLCLLACMADCAIMSEAQHGWYLSLVRPVGTPPNWLFGVVWVAVHGMIGVAAWQVWRYSLETRPLRLWGWLLATNVLWAPAFLAMHSPLLALAVSLALLGQIAFVAPAFAYVRRSAGWLLAPYFAWTAYVTYLTAGFWWLNPI